MKLIRWVVGILILFWIIALVFRIGGALINFILIIAIFLIVWDIISNIHSKSKHD